MQRMTQPKLVSLIVSAAAIAWTTVAMSPAIAGPPSVVHADADYDASGYVTPAGMVPPSMYYGGVRPVGFLGGGCDSCGGGCSSGYCDSGCDSLGGGLSGGSCLGSGGLLGKMKHRGFSPLCFFCRGNGCSACQMLGGGYLLGAMSQLAPYQDAGQCALRWYDLSIEGLFLSHSNGSLSGPVTSQDPLIPSGQVVLSLGDADSGGELESGIRLSGALIFGAGGDLEATYMGGHEWRSEAVAFPAIPNTPTLFSFVSDFGDDPAGGFDDTDRSLVQSVSNRSAFHSVELNYRRRTMGPYCRFQGSWLVGLRYLRFDNGLLYAAQGENDNTVNADLPRFFSSNDFIKNNLFGAQGGFDLWWNVMPGINMGVGMKGAWVQNDAKRRLTYTANSINAGGPGVAVFTETDREPTVIGEFEAKIIYRFSHSWSFRSAYYAIAVDDIAFGTVDQETIREFVTVQPGLSDPADQFNSLVLQGFSVGAEYIW